jgi:hypothetical protein
MTDPLEQFAPLLDPERMREALQERLPECRSGEWVLTGCAIQHPRYKTYFSPENLHRSDLSLVYHLRGRHPASPSHDERILYARAFLGGRSLQEFQAAQQSISAESRNHLIHLADLDMVGWRFPNDPAMPWLRDLMDPARMPALLPADCRTPQNLLERPPAIEIVNYRPEIRCTARYRFRAQDQGTETVIYGKTYADGRGERIFRNLVAIGSQSEQAPAFAVPKSYGYDHERRVLWLEELAGTPLKDGLTELQPTLPTARLALALAAFHRISLPDLEVIKPRQQLLEFDKKARKLAKAYPDIERLLEFLMDNLRRNCPRPEPASLIHGDFHVDQLADLPDGRLALFDFDELAAGDPLLDLANFAADLFSYPVTIDDVDRIVERLFIAYGSAADRRPDPERFIWHLRGQLLTRAYRAHIQQKSCTDQQVLRLVALARRPHPYSS